MFKLWKKRNLVIARKSITQKNSNSLLASSVKMITDYDTDSTHRSRINGDQCPKQQALKVQVSRGVGDHEPQELFWISTP